jgi:hypothetical protein
LDPTARIKGESEKYCATNYDAVLPRVDTLPKVEAILRLVLEENSGMKQNLICCKFFLTIANLEGGWLQMWSALTAEAGNVTCDTNSVSTDCDNVGLAWDDGDPYIFNASVTSFTKFQANPYYSYSKYEAVNINLLAGQRYHYGLSTEKHKTVCEVTCTPRKSRHYTWFGKIYIKTLEFCYSHEILSI